MGRIEHPCPSTFPGTGVTTVSFPMPISVHSHTALALGPLDEHSNMVQWWGVVLAMGCSSL
eukprot:4284142-Karenia_brevis.AAC.1